MKVRERDSTKGAAQIVKFILVKDRNESRRPGTLGPEHGIAVTYLKRAERHPI